MPPSELRVARNSDSWADTTVKEAHHKQSDGKPLELSTLLTAILSVNAGWSSSGGFADGIGSGFEVGGKGVEVEGGASPVGDEVGEGILDHHQT